MKKKSTKLKFSTIVSVLLCFIFAVLLWLVVGYADAMAYDTVSGLLGGAP